MLANDQTAAPGRPAPPFSDRWPNKKCFHVGVMLAKGYSYPAIATQLADGTTKQDLTAMASFWGYVPKAKRRGYSIVEVSMAGRHRTKIAMEAIARGMDLPDLVSEVMAAVARDSLWAAVLDN